MPPGLVNLKNTPDKSGHRLLVLSIVLSDGRTDGGAGQMQFRHTGIAIPRRETWSPALTQL